MKSCAEPTGLEVHSIYSGLDAETTRSDFAEASTEKIQKDYLDYYAAKYSKIKLAKPIRFQDFPYQNRFEVWEAYTIPDFWTRKTPDAPWKAEFSPHIVSDAIGTAPSAQRANPFHVQYPSDVSEDVEVHMFENWTVDPTTADQTTPYFIYTDHPTGEKNVIHFKYRYATQVPFVMPDKIAEYHDEIKKPPGQPRLQPELHAPGPTRARCATGSAPTFPAELADLRNDGNDRCRSRLPRVPDLYDAAAVSATAHPARLAALRWPGRMAHLGRASDWWCARPWKSNRSSPITAWSGDLSQWNLFTTPGAAHYDPLWAPTLLFEVAFTTLLPVLSVLALVLLFQKRWIFPRIMITILLAVLAFKIADVALAGQIP